MMVERKHLFYMVLINSLLVPIVPCDGQTGQYKSFRSPDGKYMAVQTRLGNDLHYKVIEVETSSEIMVTHARYITPIDVKAAIFSPDSKKFAAAYHYEHKERYTWIGIWDIKSGALIGEKQKPGFITNISFVFKKIK